jgi:hypothetical protein
MAVTPVRRTGRGRVPLMPHTRDSNVLGAGARRRASGCRGAGVHASPRAGTAIRCRPGTEPGDVPDIAIERALLTVPHLGYRGPGS